MPHGFLTQTADEVREAVMDEMRLRKIEQIHCPFMNDDLTCRQDGKPCKVLENNGECLVYQSILENRK